MIEKPETRNRRNRRLSKSERGQSMMELAISMTFLLTLLAAIIELGWGFYTMIALRDAAQEAAAFGSVCPDRIDKVEQRFFKSSTAPIDMADTTFEMCVVDPAAENPNECVADPEIGLSIKVTVTQQHEIVTPFVSSFIGAQAYPIRVTTLNTVLRTTCFE